MLTRMTPRRAVANWVNTHSGRLGDQMPGRSPPRAPPPQKPPPPPPPPLQKKPRSHPVYGFRNLAPAPADPVLDKNKGGLSAMCFDSAVQQAADGLCHQVWHGGSAHM